MYVFQNTLDLRQHLDREKELGHTIGFVPTMGALHDGHMSLVKAALVDNDTVVASIFVNPAQFNESSDLEAYPRPVETDIHLLHQAGCHVAFVPSEEDVYPEGYVKPTLDFGGIDKRMEGAMRPGHFAGVGEVMYQLLHIVQPDQLYMGQKDFQQTCIVQSLIEQTGMPVNMVICPTVREEHGLAMSSRNTLLSPDLRQRAAIIYETLLDAQKSLTNTPVQQVRDEAMSTLSIPDFRPEYFEVADGYTLEPVEDADEHEYIVICCAVWAGDVRLIDNVIVKPG